MTVTVYLGVADEGSIFDYSRTTERSQPIPQSKFAMRSECSLSAALSKAFVDTIIVAEQPHNWRVEVTSTA